MIVARLVFCALALATLAVPVFGQEDDGDVTTGDTIRLENGPDTLDPDDAFFQDVEDSDDSDSEDEPGFFRERGGFFGGPTVELTTLNPKDLDPVLDGRLVIYGAQGYMLLSSWLVGGGGFSAHLYDIHPSYERFEYGYGGFLTGYDTRIFDGALSLRGSVLIGAGGIEMLKKRPDLSTDSVEILERYRDEGFFLLRPGISIGFSPSQFMEFRLAADYLLPFGGSDVNDLRNATYGLHVMVGIGD